MIQLQSLRQVEFEMNVPHLILQSKWPHLLSIDPKSLEPTGNSVKRQVTDKAR